MQTMPLTSYTATNDNGVIKAYVGGKCIATLEEISTQTDISKAKRFVVISDGLLPSIYAVSHIDDNVRMLNVVTCIRCIPYLVAWFEIENLHVVYGDYGWQYCCNLTNGECLTLMELAHTGEEYCFNIDLKYVRFSDLEDFELDTVDSVLVSLTKILMTDDTQRELLLEFANEYLTLLKQEVSSEFSVFEALLESIK